MKLKYDPAETEPFFPRQAIHHALATAGVILLLFGLAAFGVQEHDVADPILTSPVPQPDWLFIMFFQVTRYFQDSVEMIGVFWLPAAIMLGMFLLPFLDRAKKRRKLVKWSLVSVSMVIILLLMVFTYHTSSTTPIWSCAACHKKGFGEAFANAPEKVAALPDIYDNKWLALHYRYPQYFWMMDPDVPAW